MQKRHNVSGIAKLLHSPVRSLSSHVTAVVHEAIQDTGHAKDAQVFNNADFSKCPIEVVGETSFDA